jgi:hypothetical protein
MKKLSKALSFLGVYCFLLAITATTSYANNQGYVAPFNIEVECNLIETAINSQTSQRVENGRLITTTTYLLNDGATLTDSLNTPLISLFSNSGTATTTRTRTHSTWGSIDLTGSFSWWRATGPLGLPFAYVEATSVSASRRLSNSSTVVSTWSSDRDRGAQSVGKAAVWVEYYMYTPTAPMLHWSGTFKITCNDNGTISNN